MENQSPILSVKPNFFLLPELLVQLPFLLFFTVWTGGFFGGFSIVLLSIFFPTTQSNMGQIAPFFFGFWGLLGGPLGLFFYLYTKKKRLQKTIYEFYDDHLLITQVTDDTNKQKVIQIDYTNITEIATYSQWFQKSQALGSVCFTEKTSLFYSMQKLYSAYYPPMYSDYTLLIVDTLPDPYLTEWLFLLKPLFKHSRIKLSNIPNAKEVYALLTEKTSQ